MGGYRTSRDAGLRPCQAASYNTEPKSSADFSNSRDHIYNIDGTTAQHVITGVMQLFTCQRKPFTDVYKNGCAVATVLIYSKGTLMPSRCAGVYPS